MQRAIVTFARDEGGGVTVDWVVLTAGVITLLFLLVLTPVRNAVRELAVGIGNEIGMIDESLFGTADSGDNGSSG